MVRSYQAAIAPSHLRVAQSHTPCNRCVCFAATVASGHATLATKRTLLLTWVGLSPAGSHQLCLAHSFDHLVGGYSRNGIYGACGIGSLRLDVGRPDHLGPLLGLVGDELAEVGGRARKRRAA